MRYEYSAPRERAGASNQPTHNAHFFNHSLVIGLTVNRKWILPENKERKKARKKKRKEKCGHILADYLQLLCRQRSAQRSKMKGEKINRCA